MTYRRGLRRLAFLVTILYWCFVAWWILAPVDVSPYYDGPVFISQDFAIEALCCAALIYFFIMAFFWALFGFYGPYDGYYRGGCGCVPPRRRVEVEAEAEID
jgi:hypothetical protein